MNSQRVSSFDKKSHDHVTTFLSHYEWLMGWARQYTRGVSEEAEDLVQDLYIRFVATKPRPVFEDDDHIRAYLYKSLKNTFLSKKLRTQRDAISGLNAVAFDSLEFAIPAIDRNHLFQVRDDLARICEYACIRRRTNRAASAFILRFFFGYLSDEVAAFLKAKQANVYTLIETARLEAKAYLYRPNALHFLRRSERKFSEPFYPHFPEQPETLFAEFQRQLFSQPEGTCLPPEELRDRYLRPSAPAIKRQEIAHLTSCRACLSQASRDLGLPDLKN